MANILIGHGLIDTETERAFLTNLYAQGLIKPDEYRTLNNLIDEQIIINKAEIILPCENYSFDNFSPSSNLFLTRRNAENEYEFLPDFFEGKLGGEYNSSDKNYTFNITRHINEIMAQKIDNDTLKIFPAGGGITANRTILNGINSIKKDKAKAIITYTKY